MGGYTVPNVARPLIALALGWAWVLALRFLDRVGKGLRTSPRDALVAAAVDTQTRGRAFGFHRAMDHAGAMLGPLLAFLLLQAGVEMRQVFLASVVPGTLVVVLLILALPAPVTSGGAEAPRLRWRTLDARVRGLIFAAGGLALATVPEAFLVLWASYRGLEVVWVPLLWAAAHAVRALVSTPAGVLSDRIGRPPVVIIGWFARIGLLLAFAVIPDGPLLVWTLFLLYAAATAFTEGAERALIGDFVPREQRATAFGIYHLVSGLLVLPGAVVFGSLWQWVGLEVAFFTAAAVTVISAAGYLMVIRR